MANSDKNILITPSVGLSTSPTIKFNGANNTPTTLRVLDDGTVSFEGTAGQLFSISDGLTGSIFSVNDISGIPSIEVLDTGLVKLNQYGGSTVFGTSAAIQNGSSVNAKVSISTASATTPGLIIKGVSSQTANLQEWQDSSGTNTLIPPSGGLFTNQVVRIGSISANNESQLAVYSVTTNRTNIIAKGAASQTADLQQWQNSAGTVLSRIDAYGRLGISTSMLQNSTGGYSQVSIANVNTTDVNLIIKAYASQTANLQEWQNSAGTVLAKVNSSGEGTFSGKVSVGSDMGAALNVLPWTASMIGAIIRQAPSQTANLQEWQDSSGSVITRIGPNGHLLTTVQLSATSALTAGTNNYLTASLSVIPLNASIIGAVIRGYTSQTADLQQWQNSDGTIAAKINNVGQFISNVGFAVVAGNYGGAVGSFLSSNAAYIGLVVKGAASQTANLQEWQNSAGTVKASIDNNGAASFVQGGVAITGGSSLNVTNNIFAVYGRIAAGSTSDSGAQLESYPSSATKKGLIIKGYASQTANLQEWQDSAGTVLSYVNSSGAFIGAAVVGTGGVRSGLAISTASSASTNIVSNATLGHIIAENTTTVPNTPSNGGVLYVEGGVLKYKGSSGTVTTIANA